jgi:hypothetical protein
MNDFLFLYERLPFFGKLLLLPALFAPKAEHVKFARFHTQILHHDVIMIQY